MLKDQEIKKVLNKQNYTELLAGLISLLRPKRFSTKLSANENLEYLTYWLQKNPEEKQRVGEAINHILAKADLKYIFSESGLLTGSGFFAEFWQKLVEKFLPVVLPANDLRLEIRKLFNKTDYHWLNEMPDSQWYQFFKIMRLELRFNEAHINQLLDAAEILSYQVAALGFDKNITYKSADILAPQNAFVLQNKEWLRFREHWTDSEIRVDNKYGFSRMIQWIDLGLRQVKQIRKHTRTKGTSIQQTFTLERIEQQLLRLQTILTVLEPSVDVNIQQYIRYFKEVVENENTHNNISEFLNKNFTYIAFEISEHGSKTGEKYITSNFKEYKKFFFSAIIGGLIITFAAFLKVWLTALHMPYFWASFSYGFNYALAFVIIHFMHGTIATKQPALTATTLALALDGTNPKSPSLHNLALLNAQVSRSQLASLMGNLVIVFPLSMALAWLFHKYSGNFLIPESAVISTLHTVKPGFLNIWYAAIAGVLLFSSGIISGYFDNKVIYGNIAQRLVDHKTLNALLGKKLLVNTANYIEKNLGAIMGNVLLGFGLGFMIFFGKIFGLPLDIRHVTISTGFFGFSLFTLGSAATWLFVLWCFLGLIFIAATNLTVSFMLALFTALKSRRISSRQLIPLLKLTIRYFLKYPRDFFVPPPYERTELDLQLFT